MPTSDVLTTSLSPLASLDMPALLAQLADPKSPIVLVSWYKPIVLLILFIPWAWVVSKIYDKHAAQFFLPRRKWNLAHMGAAVAALLAVLLIGSTMPGSEGGFWIGFGVGLLVLAADLVAYPLLANKDDRVPERHRVTWATFFKREDSKKKKVVKGPAEIKYTVRGQDEKGKYSKVIPAPQVETPEMEVRVAAEKMYADALRSRAAQIDIGPTGNPDGSYGAKLLVDGVYQAGETMPAANAARVMDFFKTCAGLDVADRRRKLQGNCQFEDTTAKHTVRVTSMGGQGGLRVSLLLDPETAVVKKLEDLGMLPSQLEEVKKIVDEGKGVVLITAPRDNGRTTLLYSVLRKHDAYINNVQTVEVDPQANLEGVRGNKFDAQADANLPAGVAGPEFATLVRSIMRRDPQVVGVAELPDPATAKEVSRADLERARVYLSFNAPDAIGGVQHWVKMVGDQRAAGETLHGVIAGKLLRKLCTNCRVAYPPAPDMLKKLGIPEGKVQQLFKKGGQVLIKNKPEVCPVCAGSGYYGQDGVYEVCLFGKEERDLVAAGNLSGLKAAMRKRNIPTIQQVAIRKAVDGITSVEEVMRITTGDGGAPAAPAAGGGPTPSTPPASGANGAGAPKKPAPASPAPPASNPDAAKKS
jgi:type II secretory ATPase GspE/PulE/Tfp pilus assembly ATPase PilB-like protein